MNSLEKETNQWLIKLHSGTATEAEIGDFKEWLKESEQHAEAFRKAETLWRMTRYSDTLTSTLDKKPLVAESRNIAFYSAAAIVLLSLLLVFVYQFSMPTQYDEVIYSTSVAEIRTIKLSDNSEVTLGADSIVSVQFDSDRRSTRLIKGDALFNVTHDPDRPFLTQVDEILITVLGTKFDVQRMPDNINISVAHGKVAVEKQNQSAHLYEGQKVTLDHGGVISEVVAFETAHFAQWQRKRFTFSRTQLKEVLSVINRYTEKPVLIANPHLIDLAITASFTAEQSEQLLESLSQQYHFEIEYEDNQIVLH